MSIRRKGDYYRLLPGILEKEAQLHSTSSIPSHPKAEKIKMAKSRR